MSKLQFLTNLNAGYVAPTPHFSAGSCEWCHDSLPSSTSRTCENMCIATPSFNCRAFLFWRLASTIRSASIDSWLWLLTSHPNPLQPHHHRSINIEINFNWTLISHSTLPHPIIFIDIFGKKKRKITFEKHGTKTRKKIRKYRKSPGYLSTRLLK